MNRWSLCAAAILALLPAFAGAQAASADRSRNRGTQTRSEIRKLTLEIQRLEQEQKPLDVQMQQLRERRWSLRLRKRDIQTRIRALQVRQLDEQATPTLVPRSRGKD